MTPDPDAPAKPQANSPGARMLGKYELKSQLGAGGMGTVYLARDTQLRRLVALKVLPSEKAKNPTLVRRFRSEAQAAAQMRHDHIVSIYENGEADGHLFISMEYVDGTDLHELVRKRGTIPVKRSLEIIKQVALALQHAAEHNIVHRDIKPSNLLIRNDGVVKLTDLGLARSIDDTLATDITRAGTTVGTVDYMSPEQGRNSKLADIRSDIYSLGCTWYHMLTGQPPYPEGSLTNKLQMHAMNPIPNPQDLNDQVTEGMVAVIQRMMAKRPQDRYQSPDELLKDLASPALTRGGVELEVMTAISDDANDTVVTKAPKRGLPAGSLPPKNQAKVEQRDDKPSLLDWETLQPLLLGAAILVGIAVFGTAAAYFGGGFDLASSKITKIEDRPNAVVGDTVVHSPPTTPPGPNNPQAAPQDPGPEKLTSPETAQNPEGTSNADNPPPADPNQPQTLVSPNNPQNTATTDTSDPGFDSEEIPAWTNSLSHVTSEDASNSAATPTPDGNAKSPGAPGLPPTPGTPSSPQNPTKSAGSTAKSTTTGANKSVAVAKRPQILSIGSGLSLAARGPALTEALQNLSAEGAVIRLSGGDPYLVPQITLKPVTFLRLEAEDGPPPIVLFRPLAGELAAGLRMTDGLLELEGLHFACDRAAFSGSDVVSMIESIDGQLLVRNCSFQAWGTGLAPVRALSVGSLLEAKGLASRLPPRVLLDRVVTKGNELTALALARQTTDVVVKDSLLVGGERPVVELSGRSLTTTVKSSAEKSQRAIRFVQSTLVARRTLLQAASAGEGSPPTTSILWQASICAAGSGEESTLLDAAAWPAAAEASGPRLKNLIWTMKDSVALGFSRLALLSNHAVILPQRLESWNSLWNKPFSASQFPATVWPADSARDVSSISMSLFDRSTLPALEFLPPDGISPGCPVSDLTELSAGLHPWLSALLAKPAFPQVTAALDKSKVVTLDISKQQDLGTMLQQGNWPPGTVLEVVGTGIKQMTPVRLVNKRWKLTWRVQEGTPLTFVPKHFSLDVPALITLEGGEVEISNLRFQMPSTKKSSLTSLIAAVNTRLTLDAVSLQGVMTETPTLAALLQWTSGPTRPDGVLPALIGRNLFLTGSEDGMRLDLGPSPAFLQNCLIVTRGRGLDLRFDTVSSQQTSAALVADHLTISAADSAFHLRRENAEAASQARRLYISNCVLAPPLVALADQRTPTVVSIDDASPDFRVEWWGHSNGIAPEIPAMIRAEREQKPVEMGLNRWKATWNHERQDMNLLTGSGGVVMTDQFPQKPGTVKPSQFALYTHAKATRWADGNSSIGVDLRALEPPVPTAKPKTGMSKDAKSPGAKPKVSQPDF